MKERWIQLQERYTELEIRERVMILVAVLVAMFGLFDSLLLHPMDRETDQLRSQLSKGTKSIETLDQRARLLAERIAGKTPVGLEREESALKRQIEIMNSDIDERVSSMIAPKEVTRMLEELLGEESDLTLVRLMSTTPATVSTDSSTGGADAAVNSPGTQDEKAEFYRHGFVIELEGSYLAALHYLESIESLPWDLSWDRIIYTVIEYPRARISIQLHTVSREENWIGV